MSMTRLIKLAVLASIGVALCIPAIAQLVDQTVYPNSPNFGIAKSYVQQIGAGRGDINTPDSSMFIIKRDPFRAVRRGRQIFQRKFTRAQGSGPGVGEGANGPTALTTNTRGIGAGVADSCASCHGGPVGGAGAGGAIITTPGGRSAPHLFGVGLKAMLGEEITDDLQEIREEALDTARRIRRNVTAQLRSKGINFGSLVARPNGTVDTSGVVGVGPSLQILTFQLGGNAGGDSSLKAFFVGAFNGEMGLQAVDKETTVFAQTGIPQTTPSGLKVRGINVETSPCGNDPLCDDDGDGVANEVPQSIVDFMEFYLLNYFKPALGQQNSTTARGREAFEQIGCTDCHIPNLQLNKDRRVADFETVYDPIRGNPLNNLFATATTLFHEVNDGSGHPSQKLPNLQPFLVKNIFTDFKVHDLGPNFHEVKWGDGVGAPVVIERKVFTTPLWGVGSTAPYGHDGSSPSLNDVILRHGGEAQASRDRYRQSSESVRIAIQAFLNSLVLFGPDTTASSTRAKEPANPLFPFLGAGGQMTLTPLFNNPADRE